MTGSIRSPANGKRLEQLHKEIEHERVHNIAQLEKAQSYLEKLQQLKHQPDMFNEQTEQIQKIETGLTEVLLDLDFDLRPSHDLIESEAVTQLGQ